MAARSNDDADHPLRERRRRKRASPWRCLLPLRYAAYAFVIVLALDGIESLLCRMTPIDGEPCLVIAPEWLDLAALAVTVGALIASIRVWWRRQKRRDYAGSNRDQWI